MKVNYKNLFGKVYPTWQKHNDEWFFIGWLEFTTKNLISKSEDDKFIEATYKTPDGETIQYKFKKGKVDVI